jgi:hypothetical protein
MLILKINFKKFKKYYFNANIFLKAAIVTMLTSIFV